MPNHCLEAVCRECGTIFCARCGRVYGKETKKIVMLSEDQLRLNVRCPECGKKKTTVK